MERADIDIKDLFAVDSYGFPLAPNLHQIQDKDLRRLYERDKGSVGDLDGTRKLMYMKEAGVVYYLADPRTPPNQLGYSLPEAIKMAKENYNLPDDWQPDGVVMNLVRKYKQSKTGAAYAAVEAILRGLHNSSLACNALNETLSTLLLGEVSIDDTSKIIDSINKLTTIANNIPTLTKSLTEAKSNLEYEIEQKKMRGNQNITTSMRADDSSSMDLQIEAYKKEFGMVADSATIVKPSIQYESTK